MNPLSLFSDPLIEFAFMRHALAAGLLVSIACGVIGTLIMVNRMMFIGGGIAHAAYGGVGLGYFLGIPPTLSAISFSLAAAIGMGTVLNTAKQRTDTVIGAMWAIGMSIGIIMVDKTPGYKADLMTYLFGSILAVPLLDLYLMVILDAVILVAVFLLFKELTAVSYDPEHLTIRGISPVPFQFLILILTALTVVISMKVVGLIMIIALLSLPVATGEIYFHSLWKIMITASIVGMISTISGLFLSYYLDLTSGPVIILTAAAIYILALLHKRFLHAYSKI